MEPFAQKVLRQASFALFLFICATQHSQSATITVSVSLPDLAEHELFINGLDLGRLHNAGGTGVASVVNIPFGFNPMDRWNITVTNASGVDWYDFHIRLLQDPMAGEGPFLFGCIGRGTCLDEVSIAGTNDFFTRNAVGSAADFRVEPPNVLVPVGGSFTISPVVTTPGGGASRYYFGIRGTPCESDSQETVPLQSTFSQQAGLGQSGSSCPNPVPEPSSTLLMLSALSILLGLRRIRLKRFDLGTRRSKGSY